MTYEFFHALYDSPFADGGCMSGAGLKAERYSGK